MASVVSGRKGTTGDSSSAGSSSGTTSAYCSESRDGSSMGDGAISSSIGSATSGCKGKAGLGSLMDVGVVVDAG